MIAYNDRSLIPENLNHLYTKHIWIRQLWYILEPFLLT